MAKSDFGEALTFPSRLKALMASLTCAEKSSNTAVPARDFSFSSEPHRPFAFAHHRKSIFLPYQETVTNWTGNGSNHVEIT
jgi:hypothetical protein